MSPVDGVVNLSAPVYVLRASNVAWMATSPNTTCSSALTSALIPPYWHHRRTSSQASIASSCRPPPITLKDNTAAPNNELTSPLWAKVVVIDSYTIVSGNVKGLGDYVVWICQVETLDVGRPMPLSNFVQYIVGLTKFRVDALQCARGLCCSFAAIVLGLMIHHTIDFQSLKS